MIFCSEQRFLEIELKKLKGDLRKGDFVEIKKGEEGMFDIIPLERVEMEGVEREVVRGFKSAGVVFLRERGFNFFF